METLLILFVPTASRAVSKIFLQVACIDKTALKQHSYHELPEQAQQYATRQQGACIGELVDLGTYAELTRLDSKRGMPVRTSYPTLVAAQDAAQRWAKSRFRPLALYLPILQVRPTDSPTRFEVVLVQRSIDQLVLQQRRNALCPPEQAKLEALRLEGMVIAEYTLYCGGVTEVTRYNACYCRTQSTTYGAGPEAAWLATEEWARKRFSPAPTADQLTAQQWDAYEQQAANEEDYRLLHSLGGYGPATRQQQSRMQERHPLRRAYDNRYRPELEKKPRPKPPVRLAAPVVPARVEATLRLDFERDLNQAA